MGQDGANLPWTAVLLRSARAIRAAAMRRIAGSGVQARQRGVKGATKQTGKSFGADIAKRLYLTF